MSVRWVENIAPKYKLLQQLAKDITNSQTDSDWNLFFPSDIEDINDIFVLKKIVNNDEIYIEFFNPNYNHNHYYMECRFGTYYTPSEYPHKAGSFREDCGSVRSRFSWFNSNTKSLIKNWLPIKYWISITNDRFIIVLSGDPSANYKDGITSFGYFGKISPYSNSVFLPYNFGMNTSSDISSLDYLTNEELINYGRFTGTGVDDVCLWKTSTGFPFQRYVVSFTTPDEFVNKKFDGPSNYTKGYHFSKVNLIHAYEGQVGKLDGLNVGDSSVLNNLEEIAKFDEDKMVDVIYQVFKINAPYSLFNNSPNVLYAICILKEDNGVTYGNKQLIIVPTSQTIEAMTSAQYRSFLGDLEVTNFDDANWSTSVQSYDIIKGLVQTDDSGQSAIVEINWKGKTATAVLNVEQPLMYIKPGSLKISAGFESIIYRCYYGTIDITDKVVWTSNDPTNVKWINNVVQEIDEPLQTIIHATYHSLTKGDLSASATLWVTEIQFMIVPSVETIDINTTTVFKAMLDGKDVTDTVSWGIDPPYTIDKGITNLLTSTGEIHVTATMPNIKKVATAIITVIDNRVFEIIPNMTTINIGGTVQFKACLNGVEVTGDCIWTISSSGTINDLGLTGALDSSSDYTVTADHISSGKIATAIIHVIDNRVFVIVPDVLSVPSGTPSGQFRAFLGTTDVTTQCTWTMPCYLATNKHTIGEHTGTVTNLIVPETHQVTAVHDPTGKKDTALLTVVAAPIVNHSYDFYFQLDWDMVKTDLDFSAIIDGHTVYYADGSREYKLGSNAVWLDHDNVRENLSGLRTDLQNMETISVLGFKDYPINLKVHNFNAGLLKTDAIVRIFDVSNHLLKTITVSRGALSAQYNEVTVCTFIAHADGTYSIV